MNSIIKSKKDRHIKFYELDPKVKKLFHVHIANDPKVKPMPHLWRENWQQRADSAISAYEAAMSRIERLHDDFIPYGTCLTGTEIFAEAFGCKVIKPVDTNPYALPFITQATEVSRLKVPSLEDSTLYYLFELADRIKTACGADALLGLIDVQTPMDIAALIWDKTYFFAAMLDEPEAIKELTHKISQLYFAFFDEWFKRYGLEFIAHYPDYYMPSGLTFSEDEIGAVSPKIFEELFLPELVEISSKYGNLGMHTCASAKHQWENFKKIPNLKLLNIGAPYDDIIESTDCFAGVCATYPHWHGGATHETFLKQANPNAHILLDYTVQNDEEAKKLADKLNKLFRT
jgi:hypothetical protein